MAFFDKKNFTRQGHTCRSLKSYLRLKSVSLFSIKILGKMDAKDVVLSIDEFKTFVPSYEKVAEEEPMQPTTGQKIIETAVTAAVWTGVLSGTFEFSFPFSFF